VGQQATNQVQAAGSNYGNAAGSAINYGGAARASGYINNANSLSAGLGGVAGSLNNLARLNNPFGGYNNPYGNYSANSYPVNDYYSGVNGTAIS
jgi:hypothetical protein